MADFKEELAVLLKKHDVALMCRIKGVDNLRTYREVGFQYMSDGCRNEWTGRDHLTSYEILCKQVAKDNE